MRRIKEVFPEDLPTSGVSLPLLLPRARVRNDRDRETEMNTRLSRVRCMHTHSNKVRCFCGIKACYDHNFRLCFGHSSHTGYAYWKTDSSAGRKGWETCSHSRSTFISLIMRWGSLLRGCGPACNPSVLDTACVESHSEYYADS